MDDERDGLLDRVVESLRPLPAVDDAAKARVLIVIAAERERGRESAARRRAADRWSRWGIRAAAIAAAAAIVGTVLLRTVRSEPASGAGLAVPARAASVQFAGSGAAADADAASQPIELVLRAPAASTVRVVGDFNGWDRDQAPMTRDAASGLWSVTLSLAPGRHVYAFVVDDTVWMRDPRAPAAKDADFGRPGSVLLVRKP